MENIMDSGKETPAAEHASLVSDHNVQRVLRSRARKRAAIDSLTSTNKTSVTDQAQPECITASASLTNNNNDITATASQHPVTRFKYDLRSVLINSNHDLRKWFDLKDVPECLHDFEKCMSAHGRKANSSVYCDDQFNSMVVFLMDECNYVRCCDYLEDGMIGKKKIPSIAAMSAVFQLILNINNSEDEPDTVDCVLPILEDCFMNMVATHPPHASYMKRYYFQLLTKELHKCKHSDHQCFESYYGIFAYCLNRLESELGEKSPEEPIDPNKGRPPIKKKTVVNMDPEDDVIRSNFDHLNRRERTSRLFILLRMFVHLFQHDLAFRVIVYNKEEEHKRKVLFSRVIWRHTDFMNVGCMTSYIRLIINLFIISVRTERKQSDCKTLASLLGTIAHAMQTTVRNRNKLFSNVSYNLNSLGIEISVYLQSEAPAVVSKVISYLKPCLLKYLVCNCLLSVILSGKKEFDSRMTLHEMLRKKLWSRFPSEKTIQRRKNNKNQEICFNDVVSVIDCISFLQGAVTGFIEVFDLKRINHNNVLDIIKLFSSLKSENKKEKGQSTENDKKNPGDDGEDKKDDESKEYQLELNIFRTEYEKHSRVNWNFDEPAGSAGDSFQTAMNAHHASHIPYMIKNFGNLPLLGWVAGRNYYVKCKMYLEMVNLIHVLKEEHNDLFKNFEV